MVALGIGGLAGYELLVERSPHRTLEYVHQSDPVVVRLAGTRFEYPRLGAQVELPSGWVYLSRTDPALAEQPTFYSATEQAVIKLQPGWLVEGSAAAANPERDAAAGPSRIRWAEPQTIGHEIVARFGSVAVPLVWSGQGDIKVGQLRTESLDLVVVAIGSTETIDGFCRGIRPTKTAKRRGF